jgi:hypothetical protein
MDPINYQGLARHNILGKSEYLMAFFVSQVARYRGLNTRASVTRLLLPLDGENAQYQVRMGRFYYLKMGGS